MLVASRIIPTMPFSVPIIMIMIMIQATHAPITATTPPCTTFLWIIIIIIIMIMPPADMPLPTRAVSSPFCRL
jgi:hypothetical protein